jgi:hypothetical protein
VGWVSSFWNWRAGIDTVSCPGGASRRVYRSVDYAVPLYMQETKSSTKAMVDALGQVKAQASSEEEEKVKGLLFQIDETNGSVQQHFRAAYLVYASAPCEKLDYLESALTEIRQHGQKLQRAQIVITQMVELLKAKNKAGNNDVEIARSINLYILKAIDILEQPHFEVAVVRRMNEVKRYAEEWIAL